MIRRTFARSIRVTYGFECRMLCEETCQSQVCSRPTGSVCRSHDAKVPVVESASITAWKPSSQPTRESLNQFERGRPRGPERGPASHVPPLFHTRRELTKHLPIQTVTLASTHARGPSKISQTNDKPKWDGMKAVGCGRPQREEPMLRNGWALFALYFAVSGVSFAAEKKGDSYARIDTHPMCTRIPNGFE